MTDERKVAAELLSSVRKAIKTSERLMESKKDDISAFGLKMFVVLAEMEVNLLEIVAMKTDAEQENPLSRRLRFDR